MQAHELDELYLLICPLPLELGEVLKFGIFRKTYFENIKHKKKY